MAKPWERFQQDNAPATPAPSSVKPWERFNQPEMKPADEPAPLMPEPEVSAFEQRLRNSPAAAMNPYAPQQPKPAQAMDPAQRLDPRVPTPQEVAGLEAQGEAAARNDQFVMAERSGIEAGGADPSLRQSYLKMPPGMRDQMTEYMVNSYFQKQTNGESGHVPVQYSEAVNTHIFRDPADGKWKPLNDLGLDTADLIEFTKYTVAPVAGAAAAGIGTTAATGNPALGGVAAVAADVGISGSMRASDVSELQELGLLPPEISSTMEGVKEGAWALGANAVGFGAGKYARRLLTGVDDIPLEVDIDRKTVVDMLNRYDKEYGEATPDGMKLTVDEKMALVADTPKERAAVERVRSRKEQLRVNDSTRKAMLERRQENERAFSDGLGTFLQTVGAKESPDVFRKSGLTADELLESSTRIIDSLEAPARKALSQYDNALTMSYMQAQQVADDLMEGAIDPSRLPADFKGVFDTAQENFRTSMKTYYDEIEGATKGQKVFDIKPIQDDLRVLRKQLQDDARFRQAILGENTQGLTERPPFAIGSTGGGDLDRETAEVFFGSIFSPEKSGIMLSDTARRQMAQNTKFGYDAVNTALLELRRKMRRMPKNADAKTLATLNQLETTLEGIRKEGLTQIDPALAARQEALDATYRLGKETLDRSIGKKLADQWLAPRPNMEGVLKPDTFDKLFKGNAGAESVRDIRTLMDKDIMLADAVNPIDMLGVVDNVRRGLRGQLSNAMKTVTRDGNQAQVVSDTKFDKFKSDYKDALEFVFTPQQLAKMENATSMERALKAAEADRKAIEQKIMSFPWGSKSLADNPTQLMRQTWGPADDLTKLQRSRELRDAIRRQGDPDGLMADYRSLIAHDMMTKVSDGGTINPHKLADYLAKHQEQLTEWYTTPRDAKSGTQLVGNLKRYSDIGQAIMENGGLTHSDKNRMMQALNSMARAYVGIFTTPGRVLTAVKQVAGGQNISREADFILNPEKYIKNQEFYEILNSNTARSIYRTGGHEWMDALREAPPEDGAATAPGSAVPLF